MFSCEGPRGISFTHIQENKTLQHMNSVQEIEICKLKKKNMFAFIIFVYYSVVYGL
jgi:hypothetical protein